MSSNPTQKTGAQGAESSSDSSTGRSVLRRPAKPAGAKDSRPRQGAGRSERAGRSSERSQGRSSSERSTDRSGPRTDRSSERGARPAARPYDPERRDSRERGERSDREPRPSRGGFGRADGAVGGGTQRRGGFDARDGENRFERSDRPERGDRGSERGFERGPRRDAGQGGGRKDSGGSRGSRDDRRNERGGEPRHIPGSFVSEATRRPTTGIRTYRPAGDGSDRAIPVKRAPEPEARQDDRPGAVRINKRMADMGLCSRREADEWVENGWVRVNGEVAVMGQNVVPGDRIDVDQKAQDRQDQQVTILLHKPVGYVSGQAEDGHEPAVVLVKPENHWNQDRSKTRFNFSQLKGLAPCGRLDIDSVGLLVLTQDGRVARHIIGEDSAVDKEYLVRVSFGDRDVDVQSVFPGEKLALLRHGLELDGEALKPAQVDWQNPEQLRFVLTEGKKRQIRRMCEQVGLKVVGLKRIRIGRVTLGNLPVGQWRYLAAHESF
jgi:23S rRNA pseudouridine2604 synthase